MYRLVHAFYWNKESARRCHMTVKYKTPEAKVVQDSDGGFAVILNSFPTYKQALDYMRKKLDQGIWCGIQEVKDE